MSDKAMRARRDNLRSTRLRSDSESRVIKLHIWQWLYKDEPRPSQRALARQLGVWRSYVYKVSRTAGSEGMDALLRHGRVTLAELEKARQFTAKLRDEAGLISPARPLRASDESRVVMTVDESIAARRREVEEWKRRHPVSRLRVQFSVPVR
jgi:hypothetical protein